MASPEPTSSVERYSAIAVGLLLLALAASLFGWGVALTRAGLFIPAGWPPGLEKLLLPIGFSSLFVGFGAWRLMLMGLPPRLFGFPLWGAVVAVFAAAAVVGVLV